MQNEPCPDFNDPENWQRIKALRQKSNDPRTSAKYQHQLACTRAAYNLVGITTSRATHGNRHCGVQEAEADGLDPANLSRLGRWNHDKMTTYYLSGIAVPGAFAGAGFHDENYCLDRDCLTPPLELQRLIFPWIESQYPDNLEWGSECDELMNAVERTGTDIAEEILADKTAKRLGKEVTQPTHSHIEVAKHSLLHLLVYLRRVIIQDAVMFIKAGGDDTPVMRHPIFQSALFQTYSDAMLATMASPAEPIRQFQDIIPDLVRVLEVHRKDNAQALNEIRYQQEQNSQQLGHLRNRQQLDNETVQTILKKQEAFNEQLKSCLDSVVRNQEQIIAQQRARTRGIQVALHALEPEFAEQSEDIAMGPTTSSAAATTTVSIVTSLQGLGSGTSTVTGPFQFSREAETIRAIVIEFDRLCAAQKQDRRLGYPSQKAFRTEYRYINNRQTVIREISYIMERENLTHDHAILILEEELAKSGLKIAAFQKSLRERQAKRKDKGKAPYDNSSNDLSDNESTSNSN